MTRLIPAARFFVTVLAILLFLQSLRALFPLAIFQQGLWWGTTTQLGIAAHIILLFITPFTAPLLAWLFGDVRALRFALAGLALMRLLAQLAPDEVVRLTAVSGVIICALWGLHLGLRYIQSERDRGGFAIGVLLAFVLDATLNTAFYTWDYLWQSTSVAVALAIILSLALLVCVYLARFDQSAARANVSLRAVWMLAPLFALHVTYLSNVAFIASNTGWRIELGATLAFIGCALGLLGGARIGAFKHNRFVVLGIALVLAFLLAGLRMTTGAVAAVNLLAAQVGAAAFWLRAWSINGDVSRGTLARTSGAASIVFLLLTILVNYASSILKLPTEWMLMPIVAFVLLGFLTPTLGMAQLPTNLARFAAVPFALLVVPLALLLSPVQPIAARDDSAVLRVMTYNIHQGIDNRGNVALEWMAQTIEAENADIVLLQEVTRSALVNGGIDSIEWLARRLRMPYHFFAADRQFGNAILTRLPVVSADSGLLPRNDEALNRNFVRVVVQVGDETLTVINTHLDHMQRDNRMPQVERVLELWNGEARTLIGGDLNAQPDSDEINALTAAGLVSGQDATGNGDADTFIAFDPFLRLDWIFGSSDVQFLSSRVPESIASDHLAVVIEVALPLGD
jgi:endonuclease/exonuclease/phosphatase family metal-dependent hydrolase/uncharacterized membrane protein